MRHTLTSLISMLALLISACNGGSELAGYWGEEGVTVTESNYRETQDRFARFAELLVAAPQEEAADALGDLFKRLRDDEVAYFVYAEWIEAAFHNYFSPCRNTELFDVAVRHFSSDGILGKEEVARLQKLSAMDKLNLRGERCTLPEGASADGPALYLVLDLDCRTCLQSLAAMADVHPEAEHIALCFGYSRTPEVPGWKYLRPDGMKDIFELAAAPFWFLTDAEGTVSIPYSMEFETPKYASPE